MAVLVDPPEVADRERRTVHGVAPGGRGLVRVPEVAEPRMGRYDAPQVPLLIDRDRATGPGATERPRARQPLLAATGGELPFRGAVELPRRTARELLDEPALDPLRARGARVRDQPEAGQVRGPVLVPVREEPLQVGRHAEHRGRPVLHDRPGHHRRVEPAGHHHRTSRKQCAGCEAQRGRVVHRAEHQVDVVGREAPQLAFLGQQGPRAVQVQHAGVDPLGASGRTARQVDRPAQRRSLERLELGEQALELVLLGDHEGRVEVGEQAVALAGGEPRVHGYREDAATQQGDHQLGVRHGPRQEQGDARAGGRLDGYAAVLHGGMVPPSARHRPSGWSTLSP